jgi:hypothetical protein
MPGWKRLHDIYLLDSHGRSRVGPYPTRLGPGKYFLNVTGCCYTDHYEHRWAWKRTETSHAFSVIGWLVSVVILLSSKDGTLNARTRSSVLKCTERFVRVHRMPINTPRPCCKVLQYNFRLPAGGRVLGTEKPS